MKSCYFFLLIFFFSSQLSLAVADCTEKKLTMDDLQALVDSGKIKTQQDFLDAIPQGSMQNFTFVTNSLSLQRGNDVSDANG